MFSTSVFVKVRIRKIQEDKKMKNRSTLENIFIVIGFIVVASLALKVAFSLLGGLFYVAFRFGIPLLIAIFVVRWLTNRNNNKRDYR
jgi:Na+/serine symporter